MPSLIRSLNVIGRCGTLFRADRLENSGVDPFNYFYLFYICRNPGVSQEALGRALYVNKSSVTRHIARLEESGFLKRVPSPSDRRSLLVYPTEKAVALLPLLREVGSDWKGALTSGFSEEETVLFERLLQRAMENAQKAMGEEEKL
ncbi:MAG: MarR family transcriptional regulator [Ruminococcaceae bacterium]|nr:MarR family transcriptional regulator [Oscillospiraceae bacterium]